jgi:hypothetical protein
MFPSTKTGNVPEGVRTVKRPERHPQIAESLEDFRKVLIRYDFNPVADFDDEWKLDDPARQKKYSTENAWPDEFIRTYQIDTKPDAYKVVGEKEEQLTIKFISGSHAFTIPLEWTTQTERSATLLLLKGIAPTGCLTATSLTPLVCRGPMEGEIQFLSWATALIQGDLSGKIESYSAFSLVVTGKFTGQIVTHSYAMIYLLGGCQGSLYLNGSGVYIGGRTTKADLARIEGRGQVYLERSDLPSGKHKITDLTVIVAKQD